MPSFGYSYPTGYAPGGTSNSPAPQQSPASADPRYRLPQQAPNQAPQLSTSLPLGAPGHAVLSGAAPAAAPSPNEINPNQQYLAAFNAALAQQRQAIDNQLAQSLGSLGARRDSAAKVIAGMPKQIAANYDAATNTGAQEGAIASAAGSPDAVGGNINDPLIASTLAQNKAAGQSIEPLVQLGAQANYDSAVAGLQQQAFAGRQDIAQQQAQFAQQQYLQQAGYAHDAATQAYNPVNDQEIGRAQYLQTHPQLAASLGSSTVPYAQSQQGQLDTFAKSNGFINGQDLAQTMQDPQYGWAQRQFAKAGTKGERRPIADIFKTLGYNNRVISALVANGVITKAMASTYAAGAAAQ